MSTTAEIGPVTRAEVPTSFARRHAWAGVLVAGAALFLAVERTLVATQNPNFVPSAILLGAAIVPMAFGTAVVAVVSLVALGYAVHRAAGQSHHLGARTR